MILCNDCALLVQARDIEVDPRETETDDVCECCGELILEDTSNESDADEVASCVAIIQRVNKESAASSRGQAKRKETAETDKLSVALLFGFSKN